MTVQFDPDLSPGSVPAVDVPAQPDPVPVWGGDGAGQHSRPPLHFLPEQPDKVKNNLNKFSTKVTWVILVQAGGTRPGPTFGPSVTIKT